MRSPAACCLLPAACCPLPAYPVFPHGPPGQLGSVSVSSSPSILCRTQQTCPPTIPPTRNTRLSSLVLTHAKHTQQSRNPLGLPPRAATRTCSCQASYHLEYEDHKYVICNVGASASLQNAECPSDHHNHASFCMTGRPVALNIRVCPVPANHHRAIHGAVHPPPSASSLVPIPLACPSDTLFHDTGTGKTAMGAREACLRPISANPQPLSLALDARARVDYLTHASSPPALSALAFCRAYTYMRSIRRSSIPSPAFHVLAVFRAIPSPTPRFPRLWQSPVNPSGVQSLLYVEHPQSPHSATLAVMCPTIVLVKLFSTIHIASIVTEKRSIGGQPTTATFEGRTISPCFLLPVLRLPR